MQLGVIGLGRMGGNIIRRLTRAGHDCVVFDQNAAVEEAVPAEVLSATPFTRFRSRDREGTANKPLSAMRHAFGGHVEPK